MRARVGHGHQRTARFHAAVRSALAGAVSLAAAAALLVGPTVVPAAADPPLTVEEAKAQVAQLEIDAAAIDQDSVGVKEKIQAGTTKLAAKQAAVEKQTASVARMRVQVGQVALAQFQNRTLDTTAQLFLTQDTDGFLNQISTVEKVNENQNTVLQDFQAQQANLAALERSAQLDLASLQQQDKELTSLRAASAVKIADSKRVLAQLTEAERQRIAAEERAVEEAARKAAEAALAAANALKNESTGGFHNSSSNPGSGSVSPIPASGKGAVALAFARGQIGKPYRFGAVGPNAYDCSGLTLAAWRAAGVSLKRTSQDQITDGRAVSKSELQPGDLVFFYSGISHVGLYAGNGMILHSSRPGKPIGYIKMSYLPFAGARRPG